MPVIDATVGGTTANSYVTTSEAQEYFSSRVHSVSWDTVDDEAVALISATNILEFYARFNGMKASVSQALAWPRLDAYDRDGFLLSVNEIPKQIKYAVFEIAIASIEEDPTTPHDMIGLSEVKVGPIKVVAQKSGVKKYPIPLVVWNILSGLVSNSPNSYNRMLVRY